MESVDGGVYSRTILQDGMSGSIEVAHVPEHKALRATIRFPSVKALQGIIARLRRVFDLGADPVTIGAQLERDPVLGPLVAARPGLRVPGAWDGFELAVRAVLGQQITVGAATRLAGKLVMAFGEPVPAPTAQGLTHLFPTPDRLAGADVAALGMPRARAATIVGLASAALSNSCLFHPGSSLEEAVAQLRTLPGIGEWTAQYIAMRALRESDALPAADIGLMRALADETGRRPGLHQLLQRAENWRPWRAYAALHLWTADSETDRRRSPSRTKHASDQRLPDNAVGENPARDRRNGLAGSGLR